ncbi:hypothetical protein ATE92_2452 [Ulvibacter sp. MAR_2010_11]|nr:hypothetical protein ATE92_2452 [Ulvibacter sp. MAR_2010_11]
MVPKTKYVIDIGFATFDLYENYLVATVNEGVLFDTPHLLKFYDIFDTHYYNRPFGYISDRKNDYTINPTCYKDANRFNPNLVGVATLCYSEATYEISLFAGQFFDYKHCPFYTMKECVAWINLQLLENKKADL